MKVRLSLYSPCLTVHTLVYVTDVCVVCCLKVYRELKSTGLFEEMSLSVDEEEHSIEMQLPYIAKVMEAFRDSFTIVPILVGALKQSGEIKYGKLLSKYLADPNTLFVISSDFCHWGKALRKLLGGCYLEYAIPFF